MSGKLDMTQRGGLRLAANLLREWSAREGMSCPPPCAHDTEWECAAERLDRAAATGETCAP